MALNLESLENILEKNIEEINVAFQNLLKELQNYLELFPPLIKKEICSYPCLSLTTIEYMFLLAAFNEVKSKFSSGSANLTTPKL